MEKVSDCWSIRVLQEVTLKVVFDSEVTLEEAEELLLAEDYEDIIDETDQMVVEIVEVEEEE